MTLFLAAQAANPFDPAPMLIQADHLEEHGDQVGAEVLRALAAAGIPSIHQLALAAGVQLKGDSFRPVGEAHDGIVGLGLGDFYCAASMLFGRGYGGRDEDGADAGFGYGSPEISSGFSMADAEGGGRGDGSQAPGRGRPPGYGEGDGDDFGDSDGRGA